MKRIVESFEEFTQKEKISGFKLNTRELFPYRNGSTYILARVMSDDYRYTYGMLIFDNRLPYNTKEKYAWCFECPDLTSRIGEYAPTPIELKNFLETQDWYDKDLTEEEMKHSLDVLRYTLG